MLSEHDINAAHLPSMQAALMKRRSRLDEIIVGRLYRAAQAVFRDPKEVLREDLAIARNRAVLPEQIVATTTDLNTGLFVQLSGPESAKDGELNLTFGLKYCQEVTDAMRRQKWTKIW
jgi:hypothetical protein